MNLQFFDDLSNFLRASFLLFYSIVFYYLIFWRPDTKPKLNIKRLHFSIMVSNFILNLIVLFKFLLGNLYILLVAVNIAIVGVIYFWGYRTLLRYNWLYLLVPVLFVPLIIFYQSSLFILLGVTAIAFSHIHFASKKTNLPFLQKRETVLPFLSFGLYLLFLGFYLFTQSIFFNVLATVAVFFSVTFRVSSLYEERFKGYIFYAFAFILFFSILFYVSSRYIQYVKNMDVYHKKLNLERISIEIRDKIKFYSNLIKVVASSEDFKEKLRKGSEELNSYLTYLNQSLDANLIWFADKNGKIIACSREYREITVGKDVSFRKYFRESIKGNLSVFIARGIYTEMDNIKISYPVYEGQNPVGVLVFQFDISESFKKQLSIENAFLMHSSGGVLIGKDELRNRFIFTPTKQQLEELYKEKIFGNDTVLPANFKQIDSEVFEDFKGVRWQLVKHEVTKDWFLASFLNLKVYCEYQAIFYAVFIILALISHYFAVKEFEKIKSIFLSLLQEKEERTLAFDSMDTGVIYTDSLGRIKYLNKEAMRLLGVSDEVIGKKLEDVLIHEAHENPEYRVLKTARGDIPIIYTKTSTMIKGVKFGDVVTIKDATETIRRQELSKRMERLDVISKITAGIVHDFNNYFQVLTGNLSLLKELEQSEKNKQFIEKMLESTKMLSQTVQQLQDLSPDFTAKKEKLNIENSIKTSADFVLSETNIKFNIEAEPSLAAVYANASQLYRVFQNLFLNARQAMGNEGSITVKLQNYINRGEIKDLPVGKYVYISITDTGGGIPEEYIDKIFDPFFTLKKEGKGLGLNIVKSIIEKLGGKIEVESKLGVGTTFKIYIPALEEI